MKTYLIRLFVWCLRKLGCYMVVIPPSCVELLPTAKRGVIKVNATRGVVSSEFKHALCFAWTMKRHPGASKKDAALAVELAVRDW